MADLEALIKKRGSVKSKLTIFNKFITQLETSFPNKIISEQGLLSELEYRFERVSNVINEFEEIQLNIDQISEDTEEQFLERERFESTFFVTISKAKGFIIANESAETTPSIHNSHNGSGSRHNSIESERNSNIQNIKLPVIQLPTFDGSYDTWLEYRDTFSSLIDQNNAITEIQKFHYLRASLSGSASQIIASLEFSSASYPVAWDLVCKRFNNTRILKQNHVNALFNLDKINEESSLSLRKIIDNVAKHLRALQMLKEPTEKWDTLIIHLVTTKLDSTTAREWEQKKAAYECPSLLNLTDFLKDRADLLESLECKSNKKHFKSKQEVKFELKTRSFLASTACCAFCKNEHYIQDCPDFAKLSIPDRIEQVKRNRLCINCLRPGHMIKQCRSSSCRLCKSRHNTLLHMQSKDTVVHTHIDESEQQESVNLSSRSVLNNSQVLLSTILINILDKNNKTHTARALLDAGSQSSFITSDLCNSLQLQQSQVNIKVSGLNQTHSEIRKKALAQIQSRYNNFTTRASCLVVPQITNNLPNFKVDLQSLQIPGHIKLADPNFHLPDKIDILLGADIFWHIMCVGQIKLARNGPVLQKSKFGWIVSGPIHQTASSEITHCNFSRNIDIDKQLARFWEVEEISPTKPLSHEEKLCESHFLETVRRNEVGKFIVTIPMKDSLDKLGDSYENAKNRFLALERKFNRNPEFKKRYFSFIDEYHKLGHMVKASSIDDTQFSYYMPHHGVVKESSLTTKLRVVFDASCSTSTGYSLNDLQMVGPVIQSDLFSLLLRHRKYNYVIAGDIEKMYRMCLVNPNQTPLQRILWRDNPEQSIETYELTTVTYGTSAAAYLAIRCLYQLGVECSSTAPLIADVIKNHFYVDDMLSGGNTIEEVIFIANEVSRLLKGGGFVLRKWASNSPEILKGIESQDNTTSIDFGIKDSTKTLGLIWNCHSDSFMYKINSNFSKRITKRAILSETSQIFDPLGLLSPCIILAKIILQDLWSEKLSWDESLPAHLHTKWLQFRDELISLNDISIPRQVICIDPVKIEMHGFSDACTYGFGAAIYIKSQRQNGETLTRLICAKSKVAPLKTQTIPRLELMGALLLAKLGDKVMSSLNTKIEKITYWCDSTIVLGWLNTSPNLLQTFVANRVARVQELTVSNNVEWRYVPTSDNPADYVSRGVRPHLLHSLDIYWFGPRWLQENVTAWPTLHISENNLPELKRTDQTYKITIDSPVIIFENYSNLNKLERTIAYCKRFCSNCLKPKSDRKFGPLTSKEIRNASVCLVKLSQRESFCSEIGALKDGKTVNSKSKIIKLNPFLDEHSIIRVGGRLSNSKFNYDKKHPALLSSKHYFTKLLFFREHTRLLHAGPQLLLSSIRDKYWPLSGRNLARKTVHECIACFKAKPRTINPIMGNLPSKRVDPALPFHTTGVDYTGAFMVKDRKGRGAKITKCYVSLFICFLTRAVHIELVSDLTKEAFIAAFRRFIARRGKPAQMFSDNGTNFTGANLELQKFGRFLQENAHDLTSSIENVGISWSFIPAHSPHFGGLWEAGVRSTKYHLQRVAGNANLTFEQFYTLLVQIEAVLNSRPMSPLSSDPSDFSPLTPSHFLIGRVLTSAADPDVTHIPQNRLSHFQHVQQLQQHFWARWSREYISELQQRCKWTTQSGTLKVNDLVVIKDDNQPH